MDEMDVIYSMPETLQRDPEKILRVLANALKSGSLNLIIGAGVSMSTNIKNETLDSSSNKKTGFPNWIELTRNSCKKASIDFDENKKNENKYLLRKLEGVRKYCKTEGIPFNDFIKTNLYENVEYGMKSLKTDLLIALGSMIMNSSKSSLSNVINYNFDDVLEWYLTYYGHDVQIVTQIDSIVYAHDIVIYHPHGFLPKSELFEELESDKIILSNRDYVATKWNSAFWDSIQSNIYASKISLFIGISGEDKHLEELCQHAYEEMVTRERILGVMVLTKNGEQQDIEEQNLQNGILTYYIDNHSDLPDLLLRTIRLARGIEF